MQYFNASIAALQHGNLFSLDREQILDSAGKIIGHYQLNTDSYDVNSNGTVLEGDSFTQNIWTFPLASVSAGFRNAE